MDFSALGYRSLESFPLLWRWRSESHVRFEASVLESIRPVERSDAHELWARFANYFEPSGKLNPQLFADLRWGETDVLDRNKAVAFLELLPIPRSDRVLLIWEPEVAAVVPFELFRSHWDDFCYPGSDDVLIVPEIEEWFLVFHHWEEFELGRSPAA